jgi:DNA-binding MarR family transcriptional regulator
VSGSKLQAELRQIRPFRSRAQEATLALLRTCDFLMHRQTEIIAPFAISGEQYNVLRILRGAGAEGLPTLEVADRLVVRNPAITRLLDKLEAKRLVVRRRCKQDRRRVYCHITPAGLALLAELDAPIDRVTEATMAGVTKSDVITLIRILDQIRASAQNTTN